MSKQRTKALDRADQTDSQPTAGGAVVLHKREECPLVVPQGTPPTAWPTSLNLAEMGDRVLFVNCQRQATVEIGEGGEAMLAVVHYLSHPASSVDPETGEVSRYNRLVLIGPEGETFASTSEVLPGQLAVMLQVFGKAPWEPPVLVRIHERRSKKKKQVYHDLEVVGFGRQP